MTSSVPERHPFRIAIVGVIDRRNPRLDEFIKGWKASGAEVKFVRLPAKRRLLVQIAAAVRGFGRLRWADVIYAAPLHMRLGPVYWLLAKLARRPLLLDYIVGWSDWIRDRGTPRRWLVPVARRTDCFNLTRCDAITDTEQHRAQFERLLTRQFPRLTAVPIAARSGIERLPPVLPVLSKRLLFVGSFIPFHGIDVIVRAAHILRHRADIQFRLIGSGQTYGAVARLVDDLKLDNLAIRHEYVAMDDLQPEFERASLCLGVFGSSEKTDAVVPNKVLDALSLGRPIITAQSAAVAAVLTPGVHLVTVAPDDPRALADAITALIDDPERCRTLVDAGRAWVEVERSAQTIADRVLEQLKQMASAKGES